MQQEISIYQTKKYKISGTSFKEVFKNAEIVYKEIKSKSKRTPYIRSKYFNKEKVFLALFWQHLFQKQEKDRVRRLKFYDCALDLIKNSSSNPESRENFQKKNELLHRFYGITKNKEKFVVQIKENKRTKRKDLISMYPD